MRFGSALLAAAVLAAGCGGAAKPKGPNIVALAKKRFAEEEAKGVDMSRGPCLGVIAPDWVADVAHNPRQPVDNLPSNQCPQYASGQVHHFVELDPNGNLIRKA